MNISRSAIRLETAIGIILDHWKASEGIQPVDIPEYKGLQAWFWIPNLYQVIEQTFKLLITVDNGSFKKLHSLSDLYDKLSKKFQDLFDNSYASYHDVHDYLPDRNLKSFLRRADRGPNRQTGYTTWKYMPLEGFPSNQHEAPIMHIGTMIEIASVAGSILRREIILAESSSSVSTIQGRMIRSLLDQFSQLAREQLNRAQNLSHGQESSIPLNDIYYTTIKNCRDLVAANISSMIALLTSNPHGIKNPSDLEILMRICNNMTNSYKDDFLQYLIQIDKGRLVFPSVRRDPLSGDGSWLIRLTTSR